MGGSFKIFSVKPSGSKMTMPFGLKCGNSSKEGEPAEPAEPGSQPLTLRPRIRRTRTIEDLRRLTTPDPIPTITITEPEELGARMHILDIGNDGIETIPEVTPRKREVRSLQKMCCNVILGDFGGLDVDPAAKAAYIAALPIGIRLKDVIQIYHKEKHVIERSESDEEY